MCMQDLRIGRLMSARHQLFDIAAGTGLTMLPNRQRVTLVVAPSIVMATTQGFLITFDTGATVAVWGSAGSLEWNLGSHGSLLQRGFTISLLLGNITGSIIEHTLPESYLAEQLNAFDSAVSGKRGY